MVSQESCRKIDFKKSIFGLFIYLWKFSSINCYVILDSFTKEQTPILSLDFVHANAWMVFIALTCLKAVSGVINKGGNAKMTTLHLSRAIGGNGPMTPSTSIRTTPQICCHQILPSTVTESNTIIRCLCHMNAQETNHA